MNARGAAIAFAVLAIVLAFAQDALPARDWYHGWQYITVLAIAIVVMVSYVWRVRRGPGRRLALALCGAIAVAVAGLLSGLIGPDTVTVVGTPGTVTPVVELNAAAFFPPATAESLVRGDDTITLRSRVAAAREVGHRAVPLGLSIAFTQTRPAAYIVVRDARGDRLTVTQPSNPSFLSPVLLFRSAQDIHGRSFPLDTFAVPALHRVVRVLYFGAADLAAFRKTAPAATDGPGAILSVSDDTGAPKGLTMAASGQTVRAADVNVTITLGAYPVLQVASAPQPVALLGGFAFFLAALAWSALGARKPAEPAIAAAAPQ